MGEKDLESHVLTCESLTKEFRTSTKEKIKALDEVSLSIVRGGVTGLVGPDGAGKTTLIRLAAGLLSPESGSIRVLGLDVTADPQAVQSKLGYMPQKFGLYEDLSVQENLDLYSNLHGISRDERMERYPRLMHMTGLGRFTGRLAGRLSGGMKQKLGLACTLVRSPDLLLLDEPTVGVDPLSRRELWEIVYSLVREQGLTVLLSTSYLDEAERCDMTVLLLQGKVLASGSPAKISSMAASRAFRLSTPTSFKPRQLQARLSRQETIVDAVLEGRRVRFVISGDMEPVSDVFEGMTPSPVKPRFEDGFMILVRGTLLKESHRDNPVFGETSGLTGPLPAHEADELGKACSPSDHEAPLIHGNDKPGETVVEVQNLVKRFGAFYAVNNVSFEVLRGEIFGLLGPNGAGKSTTFRMLCGLMPASEGTLSVAGMDLRYARASARQRIGYVAQKFSLYGQLSVVENLEFFAGAYGLKGSKRQDRILWALDQFDLSGQRGMPAGGLPGGYKQRLAMACALMHEPEILFLDEPTSGADPLARREFWHRIGDLADQGVTVIVTTHFMEEAEYCDRMVIMVDGEILATGTPEDIRGRAKPTPDRERTMEEAFIALVEDYRKAAKNGEG